MLTMKPTGASFYSVTEGGRGMEVTAYEQVTRERVDTLRGDFDNHENKQNSSLEKIWSELSQMRREVGSRLPLWATLCISFLMSLAVGLIVYAVKS